LANLRWRGKGIDTAITAIEQSQDMLTEERRERLRMLIDEPKAAS
jgi:hypothetical protein